MHRRNINRGGIRSAGYDPKTRSLEIEFDTARLIQVKNVGLEVAERFLHSSAPFTYWREEIEDVYTYQEVRDVDNPNKDRAQASRDALNRLFSQEDKS